MISSIKCHISSFVMLTLSNIGVIVLASNLSKKLFNCSYIFPSPLSFSNEYFIFFSFLALYTIMYSPSVISFFSYIVSTISFVLSAVAKINYLNDASSLGLFTLPYSINYLMSSSCSSATIIAKYFPGFEERSSIFFLVNLEINGREC